VESWLLQKDETSLRGVICSIPCKLGSENRAVLCPENVVESKKPAETAGYGWIISGSVGLAGENSDYHHKDQKVEYYPDRHKD